MSKTLLLALSIAGVALLQHCDERASKTIFIKSESIRIIDGDTIAVGDDRHRLIGFDTPETYRARCKDEFEWGERAKLRLEQLVAANGGLTLRSRSRRDKYGRVLSNASIERTSVAEILISEGLARPYSGGKRSTWCSEGEQQ